MELDDILSNLVTSVDGALGAAIGGMDGLLVEQFSSEAKLGLSAIIAEHSNLLRSTKSAYTGSLDAGDVSEIIVSAEKMLGYTKRINPEFFLTLVLEPSGNLGKARLFSDQAARQLKGMLG